MGAECSRAISGAAACTLKGAASGCLGPLQGKRRAAKAQERRPPQLELSKGGRGRGGLVLHRRLGGRHGHAFGAGSGGAICHLQRARAGDHPQAGPCLPILVRRGINISGGRQSDLRKPLRIPSTCAHTTALSEHNLWIQRHACVQDVEAEV